jgi:hypothetical protein
MRKFVGLVAGLLFGAASLLGQQPASQPTLIPPSPITIYQIDLLPTGTGFSMDEPVLEGDVYVFHSLPERTISRLPKLKVKKITRRTTDLNKEVVWQIEMVPTGRMLSYEEPVKKGAGYVIKGFKQGHLISVRETDVKKITRLVGIEAFRAQKEELGAVMLSGELPPDAGSATIRGGGASTGSAPAPAAAPGAPATGNWVQQGTPGVTDAYAPPSAVQSRPGDVPKAAPPPPKK